ncbi:lytic transglycosylase domain-containing protein [Paracoccus onubensis]|uniref:lytic transglycosylase domain-containing protein n=1 Tax=Paracoccus onubensis TaxID=1675788 RepID=UPI00272EF530|nr:lytic transglycosylase domain-containing protein [Paracoccus onubensis]MDP0926540.1 lytic transglycosylase domain-containing protein [Paracoccus onubensis]
MSRTAWRRGASRRLACLLLSGLVLGPASTAVAQARPVQAEHPQIDSPYAIHITEAARHFAIPASWIRAVLRAESAGNPRAVSSAGARGLMQVMPDTWAELRARYDLGRDPFDPRDNILAGTAYLREMFDRYGNIGAMLAAYNAGPERYDDYLATGRALPAETRTYVARLAPRLGGETPLAGMVAATPPLTDWRDAPIFIAQSSRTETAPREQSGRVPDAPPEPETTLTSSPSGALFVTRSAPGDIP